jgi:hypothetical protein
MRCQPRQVSRRSPAFASRFALEPGDHPHEMQRRGIAQVLEVRARQAAGATLAQRQASEAWREAALHARPHRLLGFERGRLLTLARRLDRFVVGVGADGALAWSLCGGGAHVPGGTGTTGGPVNTAPQHRVACDLGAWGPLDTRMPLGTVGLGGLPSHDEGLPIIAVCELGLPAVGPQGRPDHIALGRRRGHQAVGSHGAAVAPGRPRQQVSGGHRLDDGRSHRPSGRWRRGREHLGHQLRGLRLTRLREGQLIAHPWRVACRAGAGRERGGRGAAHGRRWGLLRATPAPLGHPREAPAIIWLHPHLPERLQGGQGAEGRRACGSPDLVQPLRAVCAHLAGERCARAGVLGPVPRVRPEAGARVPVQRHGRRPPGGGGGAALGQRIRPGCQHPCPTLEGTDGRQARGGSGPVGPPRLAPAARFTGRQERGEAPWAGLMGQSALPPIRHQRAVEAWGVHVKAQGLLPGHAAPDGSGRLPSGEPFARLPHHDACQAPGRHCPGTALGGREVGTKLRSRERAKLRA